MLEKGIKFTEDNKVTYEQTAAALGNEGVEVFATTEMLLLVESACKSCVDPCLEEGQGTVGTRIDMAHVGATPVGETIVCNVELKEINKRHLVFYFECTDDSGVVANGTHERFIVDMEKFMAKIQKKINK